MLNSVISVVIPAYNEEKTIGNVISETISVMESLKLPYEIIVVDDGSTDDTGQIAGRYKATVLSNGKNQGKGYALRKGFQHAQGNIIVTIDSDGAHRPKEIPDLVHPLLNGFDIVSGSRFLGRGRDSTSRLNLLGNFLFNITIMILTRKLVTDSQTGFRAFKKEFLQKISLESCSYEIEAEMTVKGLKNGFVFKEIPISCKKRKYNISKLKILSDGTKILRAILKSGMIDHY
jgi:glycosyltransferase involved in cell wall biosynthesis